MRRHQCLKSLVLFLSSLTLASSVFAQQDFSSVEIIPHHVAGSVYYLEGRGGNIGLSIGEDGIVMIDDQFAPLTEKIVAAIRSLSDGEIRFLINTHVHGDHTGGNENLGNRGVLILARDEVRVRLAAASAGSSSAGAHLQRCDHDSSQWRGSLCLSSAASAHRWRYFYPF